MILAHYPDIDTFRSHARPNAVIPVCTELLADTLTPVGLLSKFHRETEDIFLLESVEKGRFGRFSFLGIGFRYRITLFCDRIEVSGHGPSENLPHDGNPVSVLRAFTERFHPVVLDEAPPLPGTTGGLVGLFFHEAASLFDKVPNTLDQSEPLGHFLIPDSLIAFDNKRQTVTCAVLAFVEDERLADTLHATCQARLSGIIQEIRSVAPGTTAPRAKTDPIHLVAQTDRETFKGRVETLKHHILEGDIIQTVISREFTGPAPRDPISLYRAMRYVNPSPYLYFFRAGGMTLVGSSPETMVKLEKGTATLRPIAGTRPRGKDEAGDLRLADELLHDEKERAEHLMLVDLGRNDLGRIAETGTVTVTDLMVVERYSHVMHLVSQVTAELSDEKDAFDLVAATFPAGTLSGAPKIRAMELIAENESSPRKAYGGAVGYIGFDGDMDLAIVIRTAVIEGDTLTIRAGAGIVADSDADLEATECENKARAMETALRLMAESH